MADDDEMDEETEDAGDAEEAGEEEEAEEEGEDEEEEEEAEEEEEGDAEEEDEEGEGDAEEEDEEGEDDAEEEDEEGDDAEEEDEEGEDDSEEEDEEGEDDAEEEDEEGEDDAEEEDEEGEDDAEEEDEEGDDDAEDEDEKDGDDDAEDEDEEDGDDDAEDEDEEDGDDDAEDEDEEDDDEDEDLEAAEAVEAEDGGEDLDYSETAVFASVEDFPNATEDDFVDDDGGWTVEDYERSAEAIFGTSEYYGETVVDQYEAWGYSLSGYNDDFREWMKLTITDFGSRVWLFEKDGRLYARGTVPSDQLAVLRDKKAKQGGWFETIVLSLLDVVLPNKPSNVKPEPLPSDISKVNPKDSVDLRSFATPIGDQGQTSRCSAFAWTHGVELAFRILGKETPELSSTYTMLQFQKMQGDFKNYLRAYKGGDGTIRGPKPGLTLLKNGTCEEKLWGDKDKKPRTKDGKLGENAKRYALKATVQSVGIDDLKKVLSARNPIQFGMNTGEAFSSIGRDGVFKAAEKPSGKHGGHAMLIVGYIGNHFIVKNSWGKSWGDNGYCYIPKKVLAASDPDFNAIILQK